MDLTRLDNGKRHPLFNKWIGMRKRCFDSNHKSYPNYGGRGIKVCERWLDFKAFRDDCLRLGWVDGLTMDRIDVHGGYEPSNVRFVNSSTQARNRRSNRLIAINDETLPLVEWCERFNQNVNTVISRITRGMDEVKAILKPTRTQYKPWQNKA
jgi:hypothetical protein